MADRATIQFRSRNSRRFKTRHGRAEFLGLSSSSTVQMIRQVQKGFPYVALVRFHQRSGLSLGTIAELIALPQRTLMRRKAKGRLRPDESERLLRVSRVFDRAVDLFEQDVAAARRWLTTPSKELDNMPPLNFVRTEIGAREVEDLMSRLEHGVFT